MTVGATTGDTVRSPYQGGCDPNGANEVWSDEVEARGYVPCDADGICGCQGQTFGIVYHTPEYLRELEEEDNSIREAVGIALGTLAFHLNENSRSYRNFLTAFADARRWAWDPDDAVVMEAFDRQVERLLKAEGIDAENAATTSALVTERR